MATNKLIIIPNIKVRNKRSASDPSNCQVKKCTITGIVFWKIKVTVTNARSNAKIKRNNIYISLS